MSMGFMVNLCHFAYSFARKLLGNNFTVHLQSYRGTLALQLAISGTFAITFPIIPSIASFFNAIPFLVRVPFFILATTSRYSQSYYDILRVVFPDMSKLRF